LPLVAASANENDKNLCLYIVFPVTDHYKQQARVFEFHLQLRSDSLLIDGIGLGLNL